MKKFLILSFVLSVMFSMCSLASCDSPNIVKQYPEESNINSSETSVVDSDVYPNLSNEEIIDLAESISFASEKRVIEILSREGERANASPIRYFWRYKNGTEIVIWPFTMHNQSRAWRVSVRDKNGNILYDFWDESHFSLVRFMIFGEDSEFHEVVLTQEESQKVRDELNTCEWIDDYNKNEDSYFLLLSPLDIYRYSLNDGKVDNPGMSHTFLSDEGRTYVNSLIEKYEKQINQ